MPCWVAVLARSNGCCSNMKNEIEHKSISFLLTRVDPTMYIALVVDPDHKMYTNMPNYLYHYYQNRCRR